MMRTDDPSFPFKFFFWGGQLILLLGIVVSLALYILRHGQHPLPQYSQVPAFTLTERSGKSLSLTDLRGQIWVADFIFTRCAGPCPLITGRMKQIQTRVAAHDDVKLVSFSVDPEHDTPQVLSEYADRMGAQKQKWFFLTGEKAAIFALARKGFLQAAEEIPPDKRQPSQDAILHSLNLVLVDRAGRMRGYYNGDDDEATQKLILDIEKLRREKGK